MKRIVVLGLAAAFLAIPVAIARNTSSPEPQRTPDVKPAVQKQPGAKKSTPATKGRMRDHGGQCRDEELERADL